MSRFLPRAPVDISCTRPPPKHRITVVVAEHYLSRAGRFDGFGTRYAQVIDELAATYQAVTCVGLTENPAFELSRPAVRSRGWTTEAMPNSRWDRLGDAVRCLRPRAPLSAWERAGAAAVAETQPDFVVALGAFQHREFRFLHRLWPTIYFAEEDLRHMQPPRSRQAIALHGFERFAWRHGSRAPRVVAVINETEVGWARREYPRSTVAVIPHSLDETYWRQPVPAGPASDVLVVGDFSQRRNADGLSAVLREIERQTDHRDRLRVTVVSGHEPTPSLAARLDRPWICLLREEGDLRPHYRGAAVSLVPSFAVSGTKTTILQSWIMGVPVVATTAAARSVGHADGDALVAAATPAALASRLLELRGTAEQRERLRGAGFAAYDTEYSVSATARALHRAVELLEPRAS